MPIVGRGNQLPAAVRPTGMRSAARVFVVGLALVGVTSCGSVPGSRAAGPVPASETNPDAPTTVITVSDETAPSTTAATATTAPTRHATTTASSKVSTTATTRPQAGRSGVDGTVTSGPTCPVERPDQPCPPRPLAIHLTALAADGREAGATDSAADGTFHLDLPAGRYVLHAASSRTPPTCRDTDVAVPDRARVVADISCDSGIR